MDRKNDGLRLMDGAGYKKIITKVSQVKIHKRDLT